MSLCLISAWFVVKRFMTKVKDLKSAFLSFARGMSSEDIENLFCLKKICRNCHQTSLLFRWENVFFQQVLEETYNILILLGMKTCKTKVISSMAWQNWKKSCWIASSHSVCWIRSEARLHLFQRKSTLAFEGCLMCCKIWTKSEMSGWSGPIAGGGGEASCPKLLKFCVHLRFVYNFKVQRLPQIQLVIKCHDKKLKSQPDGQKDFGSTFIFLMGPKNTIWSVNCLYHWQSCHQMQI